MINKRIIIEGEKVHNVGYRPFLLRKARELGILNYDANNIVEDEKQKIVVSLSGEEKQVKNFVDFVKKNYPSKAKVLGVSEVEPPEHVMLIDEYDKILSAEQQNTVVQTGLMMIDMQKEALGNQRKMLGKQDQMLGKQDETVAAIKGLDKKQDVMIESQDKMIGKQDIMIDTIKGFRDETKTEFQTMKTDYGKISLYMEKILESMREDRAAFRDAIEKLAVAIAEKK